MLGQSKTALSGRDRRGVRADRLLALQRRLLRRTLRGAAGLSRPGVWNRLEYRPLEGFVFAVTPFNFTAIAGNLPTAPALMGNTVRLEAGSTAVLSALLRHAGCSRRPACRRASSTSSPAPRATIGERACSRARDLAGVHFTGSTAVFHSMWKTVGDNIGRLPQLSAARRRDRRQGLHLRPPLGRPGRAGDGDRARRVRVPGPEVLGRSRVYVPRTCGREITELLVDDDRRDHDGRRRATSANFMGAVIDARRSTTHRRGDRRAPRRQGARSSPAAGPTTARAGSSSRRVIETERPALPSDARGALRPDRHDARLPRAAVGRDARRSSTTTVAVRADRRGVRADRAAIERGARALRDAAGNFYVNDKPTGAVVGQQPFGGARASGTNDKAGSM